MVLAIHTSYSHCTNGMCERVSFSLATDTKQNFALVGYVIEKFSSVLSWQQCFNICLKNCQCLSFNFNEVNATKNCELNDANTKLAPEALRQKEGVIYYGPVRNYYDKKCLSFNFNEVNTTENCELNDANTKLAPEELREKKGVIYFEPVRNYYDKEVW
ncbi:hypothetical protein ACROYT_G026117 [Oculina patagonica]